MADATSVGVFSAILVRREDIDRMACRPGIRKTLIYCSPRRAKNSGVGVEELDLSKNTGIGGAPCQT